jgi:protoporphyrin/coproporphyrin ferrochelatase
MKPRPGLLLMNLGSPDSPSVPDVRRYLREFLMDGRVIDLPWLPRALLVNGLILPFRPKQSAEAYHTIWTPEGSPLVVTSRQVRDDVAARLEFPVELAMRYRLPSVPDALASLQRHGVTDLLLFPLFPHYAMSSYETAVEHVRDHHRRQGLTSTLHVVPPYFEHPAYLDALVASAQPYLEQPHDYVLLSFHGIPERHLRKSDPTGCHCLKTPDCCQTPSPAHATCYRAQCLRTAAAFTQRTGIPRHSVSFQSRLGRDPWLKPYTDFELTRLAQEGVKRLLVLCPAFVSDCLETLEEIGIRGKESFLEAGGESLTLIPCLNRHPRWIDALIQITRESLPVEGVKM